MASLPREDVVRAFRRATCGFENAEQRWHQRSQTGLTDEQLADALKFELGLLGGECGGSVGWLEYQGDGLKIWASETYISRHRDPPTLQGAATLRMARDVYGIRDPEDRQLGLF